MEAQKPPVRLHPASEQKAKSHRFQLKEERYMRQITDGAMCRKRGSSAASLRLFDVLSHGFLGGRSAREENMRAEKRDG